MFEPKSVVGSLSGRRVDVVVRGTTDGERGAVGEFGVEKSGFSDGDDVGDPWRRREDRETR